MSEYPGNSVYQEMVYVVLSPRGKVVVVATHRDVAMGFIKSHRDETGETCEMQISDLFAPSH